MNTEHYIEEITANHHALSEAARAHIKDCPTCRTELKMMLRIEQGVAELPEQPVPPSLRQRVFRRIFQPAYNAWHLAITGIVLLLSPVLLQYMAGAKIGPTLPRDFQIGLFSLYGVLIFFVAVPISFRLFQNFGDDIHDMEHRVDDFLDNFDAQESLRNLGARFRKRVGF